MDELLVQQHTVSDGQATSHVKEGTDHAHSLNRLFPNWLLCADQVRQISRVTPRYRAFSTTLLALREPPRWILSRSFFCLSPHYHFLRMAAATVIGGVSFSLSPNLQLQQLVVNVSLTFSGLSLWMWPPPHHTHWGRFFAVGPDMAELLAVLTLRYSGLNCIRLNLDYYVAGGRYLGNF